MMQYVFLEVGFAPALGERRACGGLSGRVTTYSPLLVRSVRQLGCRPAWQMIHHDNLSTQYQHSASMRHEMTHVAMRDRREEGHCQSRGDVVRKPR